MDSAAIALLSLAAFAGCSASATQTESGDGSTAADADSGSGFPGVDGSDMDVAQVADGSPSNEGSFSQCPTSQSQALCAAAPSGPCVVNDAPASGCSSNALPNRLACSGRAQCALEVLPCANEVETWVGAGRVDGYICSCIDGQWSCDDCYPGEALCAEAGAASDGGPEGAIDGAASADGGGSAGVIRLGFNDECLPSPLPMSSSGQTTCAIVIAGIAGGCVGTGLSPATPQQTAAIARRGPRPAGSLCELTQLAPAPRGTGAGCSDQQSTGWCYVQGSCLGDAGACQQDICTTTAFNNGFFPTNFDSGSFLSWGAYLVCP